MRRAQTTSEPSLDKRTFAHLFTNPRNCCVATVSNQLQSNAVQRNQNMSNFHAGSQFYIVRFRIADPRIARIDKWHDIYKSFIFVVISLLFVIALVSSLSNAILQVSRVFQFKPGLLWYIHYVRLGNMGWTIRFALTTIVFPDNYI